MMEQKEKTKAALRAEILGLRRTYSDPVLSKMSIQIMRQVLALEEYKTADTVFAYMALPGEVHTHALITQCLKDGKRVAVPCIMPAGEGAKTAAARADAAMEPVKEMHFHELNGFDHLVTGAMNIPEPDPAFSACLDDREEALVIMPGVVFDRNLNRIGYGKGFYDRYLQLHPKHFTVAVAYDFQIAGQVPHEDTDIRPLVLVTPAETIRMGLQQAHA